MTDKELMQPLIDKMGQILMEKGLFTLEIKPDLARTLTRAEYYQMRSWLRRVKRQMVLDALCGSMGRLYGKGV